MTSAIPNAPTNLTAIPNQNAHVPLSWTAPSYYGDSPIFDYVVQYGTQQGSWNTFSHPESTNTSITVSGLTNGQTYYFQVAAVNSTGTGPFSGIVSATPFIIPRSSNYGGVKNHPIPPAFKIGTFSTPIYSQYDSRWCDHPYRKMRNAPCQGSTSTIATSGCGAMTTAMVINHWARRGKCEPVTPQEIADFFATHGGRVCGNGTAYSQVPKTLFQNTFGIKILTTNASDQQVITALRKGYPCVISGKNYTGLNYAGQVSTNRYGGGHFVCLTGIDSQNRIRVNDSGNNPMRGRAITAFLPGKTPAQVRTPSQNIILYPVSEPSPL
jgi:hypothetical protein